MRNLLLSALLAGAIAGPALASGAVQLQSAVFVERVGHTSDGRVERRIEPASILKRGDRLVLVVEWQGKPAKAGGFAVTSPIPRTIAFQRASQPGTEVSIDGGRSWGQLGGLRKDSSSSRFATPEDVTHLRWRVTPDEAQRGEGRMTYSAVVR